MSQFPTYVADRPVTDRTGPEGAVPVARGLPRPRFSFNLASDGGDLEGVGRRGPSRGSVSARRPRAASPRVPGPVDDISSCVSGCPSAPLPDTLACARFGRAFGPSTRGPTPSPTSETRLAAHP